MQFIMPINFAT